MEISLHRNPANSLDKSEVAIPGASLSSTFGGQHPIMTAVSRVTLSSDSVRRLSVLDAAASRLGASGLSLDDTGTAYGQNMTTP